MNGGQVRKLLQDKERDFSIYELNKIATTFKDDSIITSHVRALKEELEQPYKQDLNYIENQNAINELSLLSGELVYLPDGGSRGFKTISLLDFQGTKLKSVASLTKELESLKQALDLFELKPNIKTYKQELKNGQNKEQVSKEMTVKIFRNSKTFDIAERFEFLKSRYDDKTLFNVNEENYSAVNHLNYLEKQLEKDLETNSDFKDEYNAMMKTAENQQE